ncbi:MAG TPA: translocation/assembly module TamB domain-containing protein, partial [Vicinamibacterales bacterium]
TFEVPRYDVSARIDDLFAGDEEVGQLTGGLSLRGELLTTQFNVASKRLAVTGSGRIAMTDEMDAELSLRFQDTSLDPYIRFFEPRLSPFTTAVAGGTIRVVGELADLDHLVVDAKVEELDMKLFDYHLSNRDPRTAAFVPIELALDQHTARIDQFRLFGDGTALSLGGTVGLRDSTIAVKAEGDANLGILPGFFRDLRSSGAAALRAEVNGSLEKPVFSGSASIANGRIRHLLMPHSLETINGRLSFDAQGIRVDDLTAKLGGGDVQFGGRIGMEGFVPGELALTATGTGMRLRYPEGFTSVIDADLALHGRMEAPVLGGTVTVRDALYSRVFDPNSLMSLSGTGSSASGGGGGGPAPASTIPLRFDIAINAPRSLRVQNSLMRIVASANLSLQGTYDHPQVFGTAQVDRGDLMFEGNRYLITRGTIGFNNPTRIEPYIDVEVETRVRTPGETYRVTINVTGANQYGVTFDSDPPLSQVAIVSLLLGQTQNLQDAELRARDPAAAARAEQELLTAATARLLSSTATATFSREVRSATGVDFQISPTITSASEGDPLTASARILLGRRISNRAYLTFTRDLGGTTADQIVVLEYEQNDRLGWILTQTGNQTFSIEFRVRHVF